MMPDFAIPTNHENPPYNTTIFEEYFYNRFSKERPDTCKEYLPVCWTNYYVAKNYGKDDMSDLQLYLDSLDKDKEYFTVVQWDDGILHNVKNLDLYSFASGGMGDYAYPLNCMPRPNTVFIKSQRELLCSFVGAIKGRHVIRQKMQYYFHEYDDIFISEWMGVTGFEIAMKSSIFALCPRGYGKTSFRICEALNYGTIPVYIYDEPWIPFHDMVDFESYGVLCSAKKLRHLYGYLSMMSQNKINDMRDAGRKVYKKYYSYEGCYDRILDKLNEWKD